MRTIVGIAGLCFFTLTAIAQEKSLYLNPENAPGIKAANFIAETELIPMETRKGANIPNGSGYWVTASNFIFLDHSINALLIFDKQGKFLYRYKKKRYKFENIKYIPSINALFLVSRNRNYTIPTRKAQQMIARPKSRSFSKYVNLELLYLNKGFSIEKLPVSKYALRDIYWFNGSYLVENGDYDKYLKDTTAYHVQIVKDDKVYQSYFPFLNIPRLPPYYESVSFNVSRARSGKGLYLTKDYDHTIYTLTPDSLNAAYRFIFPAALTMPGNFNSTQFRDNIEYTSYKDQNKKVIRSISGIVDLENWLFFSASDLSYHSKRYLFYKRNNMLYDIEKLTTDSSIYYLPAKALSGDEFDEEHIYTWFSAADLIKEKPRMLSQDNRLPAGIKKLLDGLEKTDNPVIVRIKLKPALTTK